MEKLADLTIISKQLITTVLVSSLTCDKYFIVKENRNEVVENV